MSETGTDNTARFPGGVIVPMVTPLTERFDLDEAAARRLIDRIVAGAAAGVFVLGTTGEMASLPTSIRRRLVDLAVEHVAGRALTLAGVSDNCVARVGATAGEYFARGVDAVVAHAPWTYPLDDEEQKDFFSALADGAGGAPVVLYNMPKITGTSIPLGVLKALAGHPSVVAYKDSQNDPARLAAVLAGVGGRSDFAVFVGVASRAAEAMRGGADGFVPSCGNLVPDRCRRLYDAAVAGDWAAADAAQDDINRVGAVYQAGRSLGGSLAALKAALAEAGLCGPTVMPPLRTLDADQRRAVRGAMQPLGLAT